MLAIMITLILLLQQTWPCTSSSFLTTSIVPPSHRRRQPANVWTLRDKILITELRGGSNTDDEELDAYVESLIAGVSDDDDNDEGEDHILKKETSRGDAFSRSSSTSSSKRRRRRTKKKKGISVKIEEERSSMASSSVGSSTNSKVEIEEASGQNIKLLAKEGPDADINQRNEPSDDKEEPIGLQGNDNDDDGEEGTGRQQQHDTEIQNEPQRPESAPVMPPARPSPPPNYIQRFLLSKGKAGRALAASTLLISEMVHRYLPELHRLLVSFIPEPSYRRGTPGRTGKKSRGVNRQYAAFVSGESVGAIKRSKEQKKEMDRVAMQKLQKVRNGKYAYLSTAFMKKYNLGKYAAEAKMFEKIIAPLEGSSSLVAEEEGDGNMDKLVEDAESEEEEDWVVQALSGKGDGDDDIDEGEDYFDTKKISRSVIDAARQSKIITPTRKDTRVQGSDRDGGGGVMGRLRSVGANSGVSSRILGAYPGDAAPIEKAANKFGVIDLAAKYGYGEWSESEEDENFRETRGQRKRKRKRKRTSEQSYQRSPPTQSISFSFGVGHSSSSKPKRTHRRSSRVASRRHPSTANTLRRKRTITRTSSSILGESNLGHRPDHKKTKSQPPTKDEVVKRLERSSRIPYSSSSSMVQGPMKRTEEFRKKKRDSES